MDSSELTLAVAYQRARREFGDSQVVSRIDGTVVTHSYTELFARVDRLAWALTSLGIGRETGSGRSPGTTRPRAYVVLDSDATGDQLREFLMERFPKFWVPDVVQALPEIPLTSVGKFDKKALRQRVQGESGRR